MKDPVEEQRLANIRERWDNARFTGVVRDDVAFLLEALRRAKWYGDMLDGRIRICIWCQHLPVLDVSICPRCQALRAEKAEEELVHRARLLDSVHQTLISCVEEGPQQPIGRLLWRLKVCNELIVR